MCEFRLYISLNWHLLFNDMFCNILWSCCPLVYEGVYLPIHKVADTPFHILGDDAMTVADPEGGAFEISDYKNFRECIMPLDPSRTQVSDMANVPLIPRDRSTTSFHIYIILFNRLLSIIYLSKHKV